MPHMPFIIDNVTMNILEHIPLRVSERASLRYRSPGAAKLSFPRHCPLLSGMAGSRELLLPFRFPSVQVNTSPTLDITHLPCVCTLMGVH